MFSLSLIPLLASLSAASVLPRQTLILETNATLFLGSMDCTAGQPTLTATFDSDTCFQLRVESYSFQNIPDQSCTFTTYSGKACETETGTVAMPAGGGDICVVGVVDGGTGPGAGKSGKFTCP